MIKNERQYRITKAQAREFRLALDALAPSSDEAQDLLRFELHRDAIRSQLTELEEQLTEYEQLKANPGVIEVSSTSALPRALIQARIASGITQLELAEKLGIKEQQIQRYEATEYAGVAMDRVYAICQALGVNLRHEIHMPKTPRSLGSILNKLNAVGLKKEFVLGRLWPSSLLSNVADHESSSVFEFLQVLQRVFGWDGYQFDTDEPLPLTNLATATPAYKRTRRQAIARATPYVIYAHYIASLVAKCVALPSSAGRLVDSGQLHKQLFAAKNPSFEEVLTFCWDSGVALVALSDPGSFHAAWWRLDGKDICILKQRTASLERWIIDALHEYRHTTQPNDQQVVIDEKDFIEESTDNPLERDATAFAVFATLGPSPQKLAEDCVQRAAGKVELLKRAVAEVASESNVGVGFLANYVAHRLAKQEMNWWGAAHKLQTHDDLLRTKAIRFLKERLDTSALEPLDRALLTQALAED